MTKPHLAPWRVLSESRVFSADPYLTVDAHSVELPDGRRVDDFYRVFMPDFAVVFPETADDRIIALRTYKHGAGRTGLIFPGGHLAARESPLAAAKRELLEETGYQASEWHALGHHVTNLNHHCQTASLFRATDCRRVAEPNSGDLEAMEVALLTRKQMFEAAGAGGFLGLTHVALLAIATHPVLSS